MLSPPTHSVGGGNFFDSNTESFKPIPLFVPHATREGQKKISSLCRPARCEGRHKQENNLSVVFLCVLCRNEQTFYCNALFFVPPHALREEAQKIQNY